MTTGTVLLFAMTLCFVSPAQAQETNPLVLTQTIAFPNVQGGFNHMSVHADRQRLFAAALTNQTLEIVDLKSGKPWRSLAARRRAGPRRSRAASRYCCSDRHYQPVLAKVRLPGNRKAHQ